MSIVDDKGAVLNATQVVVVIKSDENSAVSIIETPQRESAAEDNATTKTRLAIVADNATKFENATQEVFNTSNEEAYQQQIQELPQELKTRAENGNLRVKKKIQFQLQCKKNANVRVTIGPLEINENTVLYKQVNDRVINLTANARAYNLDINGSMVSYNITDNGELDASNDTGSISDPLYVAEETTTETEQQSDSSNSGSSLPFGCIYSPHSDGDFTILLLIFGLALLKWKKALKFLN